MSKKEKREKKQEKEVTKVALVDISFTKKNMLFFGIGLGLVIVGFILLSTGSTVLAPILLVAGYLVFFPLGILLK